MKGNMETDQLPPHDEKAEGLLLACAVHRPSILNGLVTDLFYMVESKDILTAMKRFKTESRPSVEVPEQFEHDLALGLPAPTFTVLNTALNELPSAAGWSYWLGIVSDHAQARKLMKMEVDLKSAAAKLANGDKSAIQGITKSLNEVSALGAVSEDSVSNMRTLDEQSCTRLEQIWERGDVLLGIPTGFEKLNKFTNGLQPEKFYVVAGRPGKGKSAFIVQLAHYAAASDYPTLFMSLEMPSSEIYDRVLSIISHVDLKKFQYRTATQGDFDNLAKARFSLRQLKLQFTHKALKLSDVLFTAEKAIQEGAKLIVVDYIQRVSVPESRENRAIVIGIITCALKDLSLKHGVAVLAAAQINRDAEKEDREPILSDLRESGAIEQDADWVGFLHESAPEVTDLIIRKNRAGPEGKIAYGFNKPIFRFDEK